MLPRRRATLRGVPRFEPFLGVRYDTGRVALADVVAPPYDVLSEDERAVYADRHPRNIVHVDVPAEADGVDRYTRAAELLAAWRDDGTLVTDPRPSLTIYRMRFMDHTGRARATVGVIGALAVTDPEGGVLPHERTTPKASTDRLDLTRATRANLSPIWGLSLAEGLSDLLSEPARPLGTIVDDDGVTHEVERLDDPDRCGVVSAFVGAHPVMIADGHHRYGVSQVYRDERRDAEGGAPGPYDLTMTYVAELVEEQLSIEPTHRLLDGLPAGRSWPEVLAPFFEEEPFGPATPAITGLLIEQEVLALVGPDGTATLLRPRPGVFDDVRDLDSLRLERALEHVPHVVRFQPGVDNVLTALQQGEAQAAVLTRPVPVAEIERTAYEHLLMPPKSTFFTPKLRTGLVIRPLD
jgi:uncharacterized protein (DUF1015 family)